MVYFPARAHAVSWAFRLAAFRCLEKRTALAGIHMSTFSNKLVGLFAYDCQAAETEALDILKGAEVERSAMLKANKTEAATAVQTDPAAAGAAGQAASVVKEPPAPVVANNPVPVVAKTEASANSPDAASPS